jgi:N-acyl-D-amino-acid deacylase
MKRKEKFAGDKISRRNFLGWLAKGTALTALYPLSGCGGTTITRTKSNLKPIEPQSWPVSERTPAVTVPGDSVGRLLLKNGLIVDGTGKRAYYGDVLINGDKIELVTPQAVTIDGNVMDCTGKIVAPGFIDMHSHMDWVLPIKDHSEMKTPFTAQGITTFVGGNCGFGVAGFRRNSEYRDMLEVRTEGLYRLHWDTMEQYFTNISREGITHNLVNLAGHGTTRTSIRGFNPIPLSSDEMREMLYLLEEAMDQGAYGVSLGLQYEPGIFATMDELKQVANLVKKKDKILTVHMKAYSSLSGTYPLKPFGRPHNLLAIDDMLNLARQTGVRLQLSHLIFVGSRTWETYTEALKLIDKAVGEGLDVKFDTYAYHCGTSVINVFFPEWFLARVPEVYDSGPSLLRLYAELRLIKGILGFGYEDIQIVNAGHPDLDRYNGMFLKDIARKRNMSQFDNFVDVARKSEGRARVLNHRYSNAEIVKELMRHPASMYMTDATIFSKGAQNPAAFGNFPRFLEFARDYRLLTLEETIHKMTGASAGRFQIRDRGVLKKGCAADITVFDWQKVRNNNTPEAAGKTPEGMTAVFINGRQVMKNGKPDISALPGMVL